MATTGQVSATTYVRGRRGIVSFVMMQAMDWGLVMRINYHDKGWFTETARFTVTGSEEKIEVFKHWWRNLNVNCF